MPEWTGLVIVALIGIVPGLWALFLQRNRRGADVASTLTGAALGMINELQENRESDRLRMDDLLNRLKRMEEEHAQVQMELHQARKELHHANQRIAELEQHEAASAARIAQLEENNRDKTREIERLKLMQEQQLVRIQVLEAENEQLRKENHHLKKK